MYASNRATVSSVPLMQGGNLRLNSYLDTSVGLEVLKARAELRWGIPECFTMMEMRRNGPIPALASCEDAHVQ